MHLTHATTIIWRSVPTSLDALVFLHYPWHMVVVGEVSVEEDPMEDEDKLVVMIMFMMVMMMVVMNMMTIRACGQCGWCLMGQVSPGNQKKSINFFPLTHRYSHLNSISRTVVGQSLKSHSGLRANIDNWMFWRQKDGKAILMQEFTWSFGTGPLSTGTPRTRTKPSLIKMVKMVK